MRFDISIKQIGVRKKQQMFLVFFCFNDIAENMSGLKNCLVLMERKYEKQNENSGRHCSENNSPG